MECGSGDTRHGRVAWVADWLRRTAVAQSFRYLTDVPVVHEGYAGDGRTVDATAYDGIPEDQAIGL